MLSHTCPKSPLLQPDRGQARRGQSYEMAQEFSLDVPLTINTRSFSSTRQSSSGKEHLVLVSKSQIETTYRARIQSQPLGHNSTTAVAGKAGVTLASAATALVEFVSTHDSSLNCQLVIQK